MEIYNSIEKIPGNPGTVIALGMFDGVHKGHQELISKAVSQARERGLKSLVFTFSNNPRNVITGKNEIKEIFTMEEKIRLIEDLGVDYLVLHTIDREFLNMEPEDFVEEILLKTYHMKGVCCGFNYRFGAGGSGKPELLQKLGEKNGFSVDIVPPYSIQRTLVSSTLLRAFLREGQPDLYPEFTGRPYSICGTVKKGNKIGHTIGFPTLNLVPGENLELPSNGVYAAICEIKGTFYQAVANVGYKPTIGSCIRTVETNLLDFSGDLYDEKVRIYLFAKLRPEKKFESLEALQEQIGRDCENAKKWHDKNKIDL